MAKRRREHPGVSAVLASWGAPQHLAGDDFGDLVDSISFAFLSPHRRAAAKLPGDRTRTADGGRFKRDDPSQHWVPARTNPLLHVRQAVQAGTPPEQRRGGYELSESLKRTLRVMLDKGLQLNAFRRSQLSDLEELARACEPFTARLREWARCPPHVHQVAGGVNVGLLVVMVEASGWPDHALPLGFLEGMNVVGIIEDSGVFRPVIHDEDVTEFVKRRDDIAAGRTSAPGNVQWAHDVHRMVRSCALKAQSEGGEKLEALRVAAAKTEDEVRAGTMLPGISLETLLQEFSQKSDGSLLCRPMRRFAVRQGTKQVRQPDGSVREEPKWRLIDDAKRSLSNAMTRPSETIVLPRFTAPGLMGAFLAEECLERGEPVPHITFGTDDLRLAYRRIPTSQPEYTVVAIWSFKDKAVRFYKCPGHNFGLVASVTNFMRFPAFMCWFAQQFAAVACEAYVDDYATVDISRHKKRKVVAGNGQSTLSRIHDLVGIGFEPEKHCPQAQQGDFLGGTTDLAPLQDPVRPRAECFPSEKRMSNILQRFAECEQDDDGAGACDAATASALAGKLGFTCSLAALNVGRSATQPLYQRAHRDPIEERGLTESFRKMFHFFRTLFGAFPRLSIPVRHNRRKPIILYTDASSNAHRTGLGFVFIDTESGERLMSDAVTPPALLQLFGERGSVINLAELLAILCAVLTLGERLRDRDVMCYVDNTTALSWAVHGTVNNPEAAQLAHALHLSLCALGGKWFFEYVPSKANPADYPSRAQDGFSQAERRIVKAMLARSVPMRFPTVAQLTELHSFLHQFKSQ